MIPISAHAAFDKAAGYFKIRIHHIPVDPETRKVDVRAVKRAINKNTIMVRSHSLDRSARAMMESDYRPGVR